MNEQKRNMYSVTLNSRNVIESESGLECQKMFRKLSDFFLDNNLLCDIEFNKIFDEDSQEGCCTTLYETRVYNRLSN